VAFNAPHAPLQAPDEYLNRVSTITDEKRKIYAAMVVGLDDAVGNILRSLKQNNIEDNTLIFFFSDNGGPTHHIAADNTPLKGEKGDTYEGGIRVPFIIQWKAGLPQGTVYEKPIISLDILPTVLGAACQNKAVPATPKDGVNLLPFITNVRPDAPHQYIYHRFAFRQYEWSIRKDDWKLVHSPNRSLASAEDKLTLPPAPELYNLRTDIGETQNLADQNPDMVRALLDEWTTWNKTLKDPAWEIETPKAK
jgi:arylsulfatase A-like enzyme